MIRLTYNIWKRTCDMIQKNAKILGNFYIQLYPFKIHNWIEYIKSEQYFKSKILTGKFLMEIDNYEVCENYEIKSDGTFRNKVLISPIFYLYYTAICMYISNKYNQKRSSNISVRYAGSYTNNELHYKKEYFDFIYDLEYESKKYDKYIKLDVKDFYNNIDISKMIEMLKNTIDFNEKEQMIFKELLSYMGRGSLPQIDVGIASSYLATVVYLDIIDNKYYKKLTNILGMDNFKMLRYVDDLYIFFNNDSIQINTIENKLTYEYSIVLHEYNLNLNMEKTHLCASGMIYKDINSISLADDDILEKEITDEYKRETLEKFFDKLIINTRENGINYKTYDDIIDECFTNSEIQFYQKQIYNTIIFKNLEWFKETRTYLDLITIIKDNNDILIHDPKRLLSAILNMKSRELIKKFIHNLYINYERYRWNVYDSCLTMRYLLYRNFKNNKLMSIIKEKDVQFYNYINMYIKSNWATNVIKTNLSMMDIYDKVLEERICFIRFLSIIEYKNKNYLTYQAYMKSFFDSVTSNLLFKKTGIKKSFYKKEEIKEFYTDYYNITNCEANVICEFCDSRNENPLCHSNIGIINNKQMKAKIDNESMEILKILNNYCNK